MMLRSRGILRYAVPFASLWLLAACTDNDQPQPLSELDVIDIPEADVNNQQNTMFFAYRINIT